MKRYQPTDLAPGAFLVHCQLSNSVVSLQTTLSITGQSCKELLGRENP